MQSLLLFISILSCLSIRLRQVEREYVVGENLPQFVPLMMPSDNTISVRGSATTKIPNDIIRVGIAVVTKNDLARKALLKNNEISQSIDKVFTSMNISKENITTTYFTIRSKYIDVYHPDNGTTTSKFDGYEVSNTIEVKLRGNETDKVSQLIDNVIKAGANRINYINFDLNQSIKNKVSDDLIIQAANDARLKADIIANALNVTINGIRSMNLVNDSGPYPLFYKLSEAQTTSLYVSQQTINTSIDVVYIIKKR